MSRRFIIFAIIGLLLGGVIIGAPYLLESAAEAKLAEQLERRGAEMTWRELSWSWPATVEIEGVEFSAADDRVSGVVERVEVVLPWDIALAETPRVDEVALSGAALTVDLRRASRTDEASPAEQSSGSHSLADKLRRIGEVRGEDLQVELVRHGSPLAKLSVDELLVSEHGRDGRTLDVDGELDLTHPKLSVLPLAPIRWSASGSTGAETATVDLAVEAGDADEALVELDIPGRGRLSVGRAKVSAALGAERGVALTLYEVDTALGGQKAPAVAVKMAEVSLSELTAPNPRISIVRPQLAVSPKRLASLRRSFGGGISNLKSKLPAAAQKQLDKQLDEKAGPSLASRLSWWLQRLDASVEAGRFDLRLEKKDGTHREITLVDGLDASLTAGELWARGESAGGRFDVGASLEPGMLLPRTLSVQASQVRLDDLPGVKEGRTLPNRGIRGRIGGVVDASIMLVTEGQPLLRPDAKSNVHVTADLDWKDGRVELSGLADKPLTDIDAGLAFELEWTPALAKITLSEGRATYGPVGVDLDAELVDWPFDPVFDLDARVDKIACQEAVRAFPTAMLGPYANIEIDGEAAPKLRFHLPWHRPRKLEIDVDDFVDKCHVTALNAQKNAWPEVEFVATKSSPRGAQGALRERQQQVTSHDVKSSDQEDSVSPVSPVVNPFVEEPAEPTWPVPEKLRGLTYELPEAPEGYDPREPDDVHWLNRPFKKQVTEGISEEAEVFVGPGTEAYVPMEELPPFVAGAAYLSEEMEFYENHGVDLGLIQKALRIDFEGERFVYGGSTVTQQLIKNLFLTRDKTLARKLKEALIAWRIEDAVPKWRVLELYLNCIEYAQDVYGIGPAAQHYFGKDARELTPKEAVFIAILKPAPWYGDRFRRRGHTPTKHWWFNRMGEIMGRLVDKGYLTPEQAEAEKPYILYWDDEGSYLPEGR
ncbi:hypothetical protein FIV42_10245 [Persicimonas caeni]|uniref:Glycosyl transferase family 51 domain-containing protein n=1 Tax=Persicimonas caeni TaxID=2292766 RepID=A0A4Y6PS10_PERCE|nr:transglycosylase domain-containing protein [Persicimonas caeni]QDG51101.1 hypothetical protein FIV42_10245 [Persicimonas caeni]QED32322.1 hypothetical protein FRD00_10240 [Persicimonas caeni]